jgi:hypothetical protein
VYPTRKLLSVARVSIKNEGSRKNKYGNSISASRPDRITSGTHWIGDSIDNNGKYPTTELLTSVDGVSIKMKEIEKLIMEILSQLHGPTALPPVHIG